MSTNLLPDLAGLLPSWQLALRAERKSPATVKSYTEGAATFLRWCDSTARPPNSPLLDALEKKAN
jgi:hypothetical protein